MRRMSLLAGLVCALGASLDAQTVTTFPNTLPATFRGNSWPFNNTTATGFRTQFIYDGSMVPFNGPILITRIRFRRSSLTAVTTGMLPNVTCSLSTSPVAWDKLTTTFANHVGTDVKVIFQGNLPLVASAWYVDIKLATPFLYDKSKGSLCFDFVRGPGTITAAGSGGYHGGSATAQFKANRIWGAPTSATGSLDSGTTFANGYANTAEITWNPAKGLYSGFTATPTSGKSPLTVQFTDTTFTSSPPVKTWAWDLDGDNKIDSTVQNPKFTYTATGWDKYFDVTLTTTDGTHPPSKLTQKKFIRINPSTATAVDFGSGSTNKPAPTPIGVSPYSSIYSSATGIRGYYFVAPTTFIVNGFEAPNDYTTKEPDQTIICYVVSPPPTGAFTPTAAQVKFAQTGKANTILRPTAPIIVKQGEWFGVFGACHGTAAASLMRNSYGAGSFKTAVLGKPITINRLWMNADPRVNKGIGTVNPSTGSIARVFVHVVGNTAVPSLTTDGVPKLGATPKLDMKAVFTGAQGGILLMASGRMPKPVPTPYGDLLVRPPFFISFLIPTGTGQFPLPIPNDPGLTGFMPTFQGMAYDLKNGLFGMTNGSEWFIGL